MNKSTPLCPHTLCLDLFYFEQETLTSFRQVSINELRTRYCDERLTIAEIAKLYAVSGSAVCHKMKRFGICSRRQHFVLDQIPDEVLINLHWHDNQSMIAIGRLYGVSESTTASHFDRRGLHRRSMDEARIVALSKPETRAKLSASCMGRGLGKKRSPHHVEKMREAAVRRYQNPANHVKASDETRRKMSISHTGKPGVNRGRKWSDEVKRKMGIASKASWAAMSPEKKEAYRLKWIGRTFSEETKERIGLATARNQSLGKYPRSLTANHKRMALWLKSIGIETKREVQFGRFSVDEYDPIGKIAFEAHGRYWHSLPKAIDRDRRKKSYLLSLGIYMIEIWDDEI